jgi:hypothetical protein
MVTAGHNVMKNSRRAKEGLYEMACTVKYLYGKLGTFQSKEDRDAELVQEKEACNKGLLEAASYIQGIGTSPSGSEEAAYTTSKGEKGAYEDLYKVIEETILVEEAEEDFEMEKLWHVSSLKKLLL